MVDVRYPIGRFTMPEAVTAEVRQRWMEDIKTLPAKLREAVRGLSPEQLDTAYREGGWTVRQVVHHLADSHMNSFIRFKLGLTEHEPAIKAYDEAEWALLPDANGPIETSLALLEGLHARWMQLLTAMKPEDFAKVIRHPENGPMTLERCLGVYAWHSRHHVAHITSLRERKGWS